MSPLVKRGISGCKKLIGFGPVVTGEDIAILRDLLWFRWAFIIQEKLVLKVNDM